MTEATSLIRALIVDDELLARRTVRRLLDYDPDVTVVGECFGAETPETIRRLRPDLIFLDIRMPEMDGLEILAELEPETLPLVIFVTAYDDYALDAFELHALDYLVKPFSDRRLIEALARAKDQIRRRETESAQRRLVQLLQSRLERAENAGPDREAPPTAGAPGGRLALRDGGRILFFRSEEVVWIEADGSYVKLHHQEGSTLVRTTLSALEEQLDPDRFYRIHRSAIVSLDHVKETRHESHGDYIVVLRDGTELRLTRSRRAAFELQLGLS